MNEMESKYRSQLEDAIRESELQHAAQVQSLKLQIEEVEAERENMKASCRLSGAKNRTDSL